MVSEGLEATIGNPFEGAPVGSEVILNFVAIKKGVASPPFRDALFLGVEGTNPPVAKFKLKEISENGNVLYEEAEYSARVSLIKFDGLDDGVRRYIVEEEYTPRGSAAILPMKRK